MRVSPSLARITSALLSVAFSVAAACGDSPSATPAEIVAASTPQRPEPDRAPESEPESAASGADDADDRLPGERLRVHDAAELDAFSSLAALRELDLALSETDRIGVPATEGADPCQTLDLRRLAARLPGLRRLRISGCQAAVHAGLDSFNSLADIELVDLVLDGVTMGRLLALPALKTLRLTRVTPGSESYSMLRRLPIERLALRELDEDSQLAELFGILRGLQAIEIDGSWAGHKTMLQVAQADRLRELFLRDTEIRNFSLNHVKGLEHLTKVDLRGDMFNDKTPLYFRALPLRSFTCACANLGESGLRSLRHIKGLRELRILSSRIVAASDEDLGELQALESFTFHGSDLGADGFAALASIKGLRTFELQIEPSELRDPALKGLGELRGLHSLILRSQELGDRITPQLKELHALEVLELGGTSISDECLEAVAGMPELQRLILHHTRVTRHGLKNLAKLHKLEVLELDHTDVVDAGVAHLSGLTSLRELRLDATLITDKALESLAPLKGLERLNIADTVITNAGLKHLRGLESLQSVNLARTRASP